MALVLGTNFDDLRIGTTQADVIIGGAGRDTLLGDLGDDVIFGDHAPMSGQVPTVASEFMVIQTTAGQQTAPKLMTLANGNILAMWHSAPSATSGAQNSEATGSFMGRIFSPSGTALGSEFSITGPTIPQRGFDPIHAWPIAATQLNDGNIVFAWAENTSGFEIQARIMTPLGMGAQFVLTNDLASAWDTAPNLAASQDGGFRLIYQPAYAPNGYDLWTRNFSAQGVATTPSEIVNTYTTWDQGAGQVVQLAGGGHVVVWISLRQMEQDVPGGWYAADVYAQRYLADGTAFGGETLVHPTFSAGTQMRPAAAALPDGGYVIAWHSQAVDGDGYGVMLRRFDAAGGGGAEIAVNITTIGDQTLPRVVALANGGFVVVWQSSGQDGSDSGTYFRVFDAANIGGAEVLANETVLGRQGFADVTATQNGGFMIAWVSADGQDGAGAGVFAKLFDANGLPAPLLFDDSISGGGGNDLIYGGEGKDTVTGDAGIDTIFGDAGSDSLSGGSDVDYIFGGIGLDTISGGTGNDRIAGNSFPILGGAPFVFDGYDLIYGDAGDDEIIGGFLADTIYGGIGHDRIQGLEGDNRLYGGAGNDLVDAYDSSNSSGWPQYNGPSGLSYNYGGAGNDVVRSENTDARLYGDAGDDGVYWYGSHGLVEAYGGAGNDRVQGGTLRATGLSDSLFGGIGDDLVEMTSGPALGHYLSGDAGNDILRGSAGDDTVFGGTGHDWVEGGGGNDLLYGGNGNDVMTGDHGDDLLYGEAGRDSINGSYGDDQIIGGTGSDTLTGGDGNDVFIFTATNETPNGVNSDVITDFNLDYTGGAGPYSADLVDVSLIDADTSTAWDDAFVESVGPAANSIWQITIGTDTFVRGDVTGDGLADFQIMFQGQYFALDFYDDFIL